MSPRSRKAGPPHDLIDQILELSHRQVPKERLQVARPRDTANMRFMRLAVHYGRSALERRDEAAARESALAYFTAQDRAGHMCWPGDDPHPFGYTDRIEQMCADPHYTFHVASAGLITLAASWWGHRDVLSRGEDWLRRHLALVQSCAAPDGTAAFPCTRAKTDPPLWGVASAMLRQATGLPALREIKRRPELADQQGWWVPVRLVRLLQQAGADLAPRAGELPQLRIPMTVARTDGGHLAKMGPLPYVRWIDRPVDWVLMEYGAADRHDLEYGRSWKTPPPREAPPRRRPEA